MLSESLKPLTGQSLNENQFRLYENTKIDIARVIDVLDGKLAAYKIKNFLSSEHCQKIVKNFWASPKKIPRMGYGEDGVEGYFIGASHIEKNTLEYLEEARDFETAIQDLFQDTENPIDVFRAMLAKHSDYKTVRPAQLNHLYAGNVKAVYWNNIGDFLLSPHEDLAQLRDPRQHGFEIQSANRVMAVNFYAKVPQDAGQLKIWNIEPDDKARAALNLTYSGFPYPAALLTPFQAITITVQSGDLCIINGNLIHAVMRGNKEALAKDRLLITCFMAKKNEHELIWWT